MKVSHREKLFHQIAALPVRTGADGSPEVLLVTTRETGRWVIPKGWPMRSKTDWEAAEIEAMEEAGAVGRIHPEPVGKFDYFKRRERHFDLVAVTVYRLSVTRQLDEWPERLERKVQWFSAYRAAELVQEPGLAALLMALR
jgi:8-oxo-dGTP pyrophosphatase MutT (NUDIX family)